MACFGRGHWASSDDHDIAEQRLKPNVERQVAQLRERSKLPSHAADGHAQQPSAAQGLDDSRQKQRDRAAVQQDGPTANGGAAQEAAGDGSGDAEADGDSHSIHHYSQQRPAELEAPPVDDEDYRKQRALNDIREPYRIPHEYLRGSKSFLGSPLPDSPLLVFINSRSGGRAGPRLYEVLCHAVGHSQVYDLQDHRPGTVLKAIFSNLDAAAAAGDKQAAYFRANMRVLAAGGDGTVAWILGTIAELGLMPPPHVAVLPLGTGNDLSLTFGWGNTFLPAWLRSFASVYHLLRRIAEAQPRQLDCWRVSISADTKDYFKDLPYSLQPAPQQPVSGYKVAGMFWNYLSVGMDAAAAHGFHQLRETRPWAARGRVTNQAWYTYYGFASGWMTKAPPIRDTVSLQVRRRNGDKLEDVHIPNNVKAIVVLNLQSYAGGRDLFGLATDPAKLENRGFQVPIFNDGLLEVVGLRGGWHTGLVMSGFTHKHAVRLAQVPELALHLRSNSAKRAAGGAFTHMQVDGEPWRQAIPSGGDSGSFTVHVSHAAVSHMLVNSESLRGIAPRVRALAAREAAVSAVVPPHGGPTGPAPRSSSMPASSTQPEAKAAAADVVQKAATDNPQALAEASRAQAASKQQAPQPVPQQALAAPAQDGP